MLQNRTIFSIAASILVVVWLLTGPTWFAKGALGRAMTNLDIWAQIHLPYPVLTLLLAGFVMTGAVVWFRRHLGHEDAQEAWNRRR
jgi:hypothetical protein